MMSVLAKHVPAREEISVDLFTLVPLYWIVLFCVQFGGREIFGFGKTHNQTNLSIACLNSQ